MKTENEEIIERLKKIQSTVTFISLLLGMLAGLLIGRLF